MEGEHLVKKKKDHMSETKHLVLVCLYMSLHGSWMNCLRSPAKRQLNILPLISGHCNV